MKRSEGTGSQNGDPANVVPFPDSFENMGRRHIAAVTELFAPDAETASNLERLTLLAGGPLANAVTEAEPGIISSTDYPENTLDDIGELPLVLDDDLLLNFDEEF